VTFSEAARTRVGTPDATSNPGQGAAGRPTVCRRSVPTGGDAMSTCPRCNSALTAEEYEGATVEVCARCGGHWLGPDELRHIVHTHEQKWEEEALEGEREAPPRRVPLDKVRENLPCPACRVAMETFNYAGDSGVILDRCRDCGGIWLDGGELEKVQVVVEASDRGLADDAHRFSGTLRQVELREDEIGRGDWLSQRMPGISRLLGRFLRGNECAVDCIARRRRGDPAIRATN